MKKIHVFLLGALTAIVAYSLACTMFMEGEAANNTVGNITIVFTTVLVLVSIATLIAEKASSATKQKAAQKNMEEKPKETFEEKIMFPADHLVKAKADALAYRKKRIKLVDEGYEEVSVLGFMGDFVHKLPTSGFCITQKEEFIKELEELYGVKACPDEVYLNKNLSWTFRDFKFSIPAQGLYYFIPASTDLEIRSRRVLDTKERDLCFANTGCYFDTLRYSIRYQYLDGELLFNSIGKGEEDFLLFQKPKNCWSEVVRNLRLMDSDLGIYSEFL